MEASFVQQTLPRIESDLVSQLDVPSISSLDYVLVGDDSILQSISEISVLNSGRELPTLLRFYFYVVISIGVAVINICSLSSLPLGERIDVRQRQDRWCSFLF